MCVCSVYCTVYVCHSISQCVNCGMVVRSLSFLACVLIGACLLWPVKVSVSEAAYVLGMAETFLSKGSIYFTVFLASCDKY